MQRQKQDEDKTVSKLVDEAAEIRSYVLSGEADYQHAINWINEWRRKATPYLEARR